MIPSPVFDKEDLTRLYYWCSRAFKDGNGFTYEDESTLTKIIDIFVINLYYQGDDLSWYKDERERDDL